MDNPYGPTPPPYGWNPPPPPWAYRYGPRYGPWQRAGAPDPKMRIGDAERQQVADQLSRHFADGRLDHAEFEERMTRAMSAKTRGDLGGLLSDLPRLDMQGAPPPPVYPRHRHRIFSIVALVVLGLIFVSAFSGPWGWWHVPWLLFLIIGFVLWQRNKHGYHHHHRRDNVSQ